MLEALETGIGLEVVQWFQTLHNPLFDALALFLHNANDGLFYVVVIGAIYWMFNKKLGIRMLFALIIIGLITLAFKDLFGRPRPYQIPNSGIIPLVTETTFGIPSGHASMALVIWGYVALWLKDRIVTIVIVTYVILMGLSRMYLGVHFPQDVLAGWLLGGIVLWLYATQVERVVSWWHEQSLAVQIGLPVGIGLISTLFFLGSIDGLTMIGLLIGVGIAVTIETRYVNFTYKDQWIRRGAQFILGLVIALVILEGLDIVFDMVAPTTYAYVENEEAVTALQAQVTTELDTPTAICLAGDEAGLEDLVTTACVEQVTPLGAGLRVLRYGLLAIFAVSLIPLLSIRVNLMERIDPLDISNTTS